MSSLVQIADFGTDYTGIGWLTVVLPLAVLALIVAWWHFVYRRGRRHDPEQPAARVTNATEKKSASHAVVPLLPAFRLFSLEVAIALTLAVIVLWVWHATRRAQS
jgi:hypothetical protein